MHFYLPPLFPMLQSKSACLPAHHPWVLKVSAWHDMIFKTNPTIFTTLKTKHRLPTPLQGGKIRSKEPHPIFFLAHPYYHRPSVFSRENPQAATYNSQLLLPPPPTKASTTTTSYSRPRCRRPSKTSANPNSLIPAPRHPPL